MKWKWNTYFCGEKNNKGFYNMEWKGEHLHFTQLSMSCLSLYEFGVGSRNLKLTQAIIVEWMETLKQLKPSQTQLTLPHFMENVAKL